MFGQARLIPEAEVGNGRGKGCTQMGKGSQLENKLLRVLHRKEKGVTFFKVLKTLKSRGADVEHNLGTSTEDSKRRETGNGKPRKDQEHISSTGS